MRVLIGVALAMLVAGPASAQKPPKPDPVRVYVFAKVDPSGLIDQAQKDRRDSVLDIERAFPKDEMVATSTPEGAELQIEVTSRSLEPTGEMSRSQFGNGMEPVKAFVVHAVLRFGSYTTDLTCSSAPAMFSEFSWKDAGSSCARQVRRWIKDNYGEIRPPGR